MYFNSLVCCKTKYNLIIRLNNVCVQKIYLHQVDVYNLPQTINSSFSTLIFSTIIKCMVEIPGSRNSGIQDIFWEIRSRDWETPNHGFLGSQILIVTFHDIFKLNFNFGKKRFLVITSAFTLDRFLWTIYAYGNNSNISQNVTIYGNQKFFLIQQFDRLPS